MKYLNYIGVVSALGLMVGCGVTSKSSAPASAIQLDSNTPVVTTGAKCASAARPEFSPKGKKIGVSQIAPGTYTYVESTHLYIGENKVDGTVIEGHVTDSIKNKVETVDVDCQSATELKKSKNYSDNLMAEFPSKMVVNKTGDLAETGRRYLNVEVAQGKFTASGRDMAQPKTVTNAELKAAEIKNVPTANKSHEFWQADNGDLYMVLHTGVNVSSTQLGSSSVTRDSIVYYKHSDAQ